MKKMGKPKDIDARRDILSAFDAKPINDLGDVVEHLSKIKRPKSERSVRYILNKMENEGLVKLIKRGANNRAFWVKNVFSDATTLTDVNGNPVSLVQFITELDALDNHPLLRNETLQLMKQWMLNSIAIVDADAYAAKKLNPPVARELKSNLEELKAAIELLHRYVKHFLNAEVWSELGHTKMSKELEGLGITSVIVDRYGMNRHEE